MMRKRILAFAIVAGLGASSVQAAGYKVIVNPANPATTLAKKDVSALFLKKKVKWDDGAAVTAVDQTDKAAVRESFTTSIHGKPVAAIKSYWQQQIFSGRDVPPVEKSSDAEVIAFVRNNRDAVGYVSEETPVSGVKVIDVQ